MEFTKGSEWRKWDLHVHTHKSHNFSGEVKDLIANLQSSEADVIGLNDYYTVDGYCEIRDKINKVIFPIVEFRGTNLIGHRTGDGSSKLNFHLIFDNKLDNNVIKSFLSSLQVLDQKGNASLLGSIPPSDYPNIAIDYFAVINKLKELSLRDKVLVWVPYNEHGGIDGIPSSDYLKLGIIRQADILGTSNPAEIEFFLWKNKKFTEDQYAEWFGKRLPAIKGSDSHNANYQFGRLQNEKSQPIEKYCWIKADPTFEGLKQILVEPETRVYIGKEPADLGEVKANKALYISALNVSTSANAPEWFDPFKSIQFNTGLVAIIGNKGSGKSALADILALAGNTHKPTFTFLTDEKFLKLPAAKKYISQINFLDGYKDTRPLIEKPDSLKSEKVVYLSQSFVNQICDVEGDPISFRKEIAEVIFSYLPEENRMGKKTLGELIEQKVKANNERRDELTTQMYALNREIAELELKLEPDSQKALKNTLSELQRQIDAIDAEKPIEQQKPQEGGANPELEMVNKLSQRVKFLAEEILKSQVTLNQYVTEQEALKEIANRIVSFQERYTELSATLRSDPTLLKYKIKTEDIIRLECDSAPIANTINAIEKILATCKEKISGFEAEKMKVTAEIEAVRAKITGPQRLYQNYLRDLEAWEKKKTALSGNPNTPGTFGFVKAEVTRISDEYPQRITLLIQQRDALAGNIIRHIVQHQAILTDIYKPMLEELAAECKRFNMPGDEFAKFEATLAFSADFESKFFEQINSRPRGVFCGKDEAQKALHQFKRSVSLLDPASILRFPDLIIDALKAVAPDEAEKKNTKCPTIERQLRDGRTRLDLYYHLFSFRYIKPEFVITFSDKKIEQLSPGERGLVLLIFYLVVSKDRRPIIIDQPEENLDNETVYTKLVPFIREAKRKRQIIIVTHNPNLAVVCDSEQVICATMGKHNNNQVSYYVGSLENPEIRRCALNILEGTKPAFNNRKEKYSTEL